jgi:glycosyltransferase involved in cell wall biosynthesis
MFISVIICTYNREKFLREAIESIAKQSLDKNEYELLLINNNSTDNTEEIYNKFIQNYPELNTKYFFETNQGLSFSRNRGFNESKGDIIVYIDDDAAAEKDYLLNIEKFFKKNPDASAIGGKVIPVYENNKEEPRWLSKYIWGTVTKVDFGNEIKEFPKNKYPAGCNMVIKREVLKESGLFDTKLGRIGRIGLASEEKDIFRKIRNAGNKIYYVPDITVHHNVDDYRLEYGYLKKLCRGIGLSEKIRTQKISSGKLFSKFLEYILKLAAAFGLAFIYLLKFDYQKAKYIILIRYLILTGFFKSENN